MNTKFAAPELEALMNFPPKSHHCYYQLNFHYQNLNQLNFPNPHHCYQVIVLA